MYIEGPNGGFEIIYHSKWEAMQMSKPHWTVSRAEGEGDENQQFDEGYLLEALAQAVRWAGLWNDNAPPVTAGAVMDEYSDLATMIVRERGNIAHKEWDEPSALAEAMYWATEPDYEPKQKAGRAVYHGIKAGHKFIEDRKDAERRKRAAAVVQAQRTKAEQIDKLAEAIRLNP